MTPLGFANNNNKKIEGMDTSYAVGTASEAHGPPTTSASSARQLREQSLREAEEAYEVGAATLATLGRQSEQLRHAGDVAVETEFKLHQARRMVRGQTAGTQL